MYVVTVTFRIKAEYKAEFREGMVLQARNSLALEAGCHQFDVCFDPEDPCAVFLYEIYTDKQAFDAHLQSDHFTSFDANTKNWIEQKTVNTWTREEVN